MPGLDENRRPQMSREDVVRRHNRSAAILLAEANGMDEAGRAEAIEWAEAQSGVLDVNHAGDVAMYHPDELG